METGASGYNIADHMCNGSSVLSASGANPSLLPFTSKTLNNHWGGKSDHSDEYPELSKGLYAELAHDLVCAATSETVLGYRAADGSIVRYNKSTNDFVKSGSKGIRTMFKPKRGIAYFNDKMKSDGGVQND